MVWPSVVWSGVVCGVVWYTVVWWRVMWRDAVGSGVVWWVSGVAWCVVVLRGVAWRGVVQLLYCGVAWCSVRVGEWGGGGWGGVCLRTQTIKTGSINRTLI